VEPEIRRLGAVLIGLLLVVAATLGYWQVLRAPELEAASNNPRLAEEAARVVRGAILDRTGRPLARSEVTPDGVVRRYSDPSVAAVTGYHSIRFGSSGIEASYDEQLRGARSPDPLERLRHELTHGRTVGSDVMSTIDLDVQRAAAQAMGDAKGATVALDPKTGAVLAMVSRPLFDPNATSEQWERLRQDPAQPLFNRAVQATYVPGSTFKTVVAAAATDLGVVNLDEEFRCTRPIQIGELAPNCQNHSHIASVDFYEAFAWSCNRTFALTAMGLGMQGPLMLGDNPQRAYQWEQRGIDPSVDQLAEYARRFGFEREIPFDLPVEPSRLQDAGQKFFPSLLAQTGFGQGQVAATPLQMALVAATIANGGEVPRPYLVSAIRAPSGLTSTVQREGGSIGRAVSSETAGKVNRMMELSVEIAYGQKAKIPGVKVGGKTGTAEVGGTQTPHSWFIGYAPSDNPRVAVAVILENKGSGSDFATPAARQVMETALSAYKPER
jgi:penicillin-binding protein A